MGVRASFEPEGRLSNFAIDFDGPTQRRDHGIDCVTDGSVSYPLAGLKFEDR